MDSLSVTCIEKNRPSATVPSALMTRRGGLALSAGCRVSVKKGRGADQGIEGLELSEGDHLVAARLDEVIRAYEPGRYAAGAVGHDVSWGLGRVLGLAPRGRMSQRRSRSHAAPSLVQQRLGDAASADA